MHVNLLILIISLLDNILQVSRMCFCLQSSKWVPDRNYYLYTESTSLTDNLDTGDTTVYYWAKFGSINIMAHIRIFSDLLSGRISRVLRTLREKTGSPRARDFSLNTPSNL